MKEHPLSRMDRMNIPYNIALDCENGVYINRNKKGGGAERSMHRALFIENPVTNLRKCERCGKVSVPKKVHARCIWPLFSIRAKNKSREAVSPSSEYPLLCMSCYNNLKPLVKAAKEYDEIAFLIRKLNRAKPQCQRLQIPVN